MSSSSHGAAASAVGYIYQIRWALLEVLRAAHERPDQAISIEKLEDVAGEQHDSPVRLLQLKHHQVSAGAVGDMDDDVWRTVRVWLDSPLAAGVDPPDLYLVTTQIAADKSARSAASSRPRPHSRGEPSPRRRSSVPHSRNQERPPPLPGATGIGARSLRGSDPRSGHSSPC